MKKSTSQTGSAHLVIIVIIVLAVLGALGYVLWNNLNKPKASTTAQTSQNNSAPAKKSEIITLQNSDMNKYVNYEQGFEFEFPKAAYAPAKCTQKNYVENADHSMSRVDAYYVDEYAPGVPITVLESGNRFIITPQNLYVLSSYSAPGRAQVCESKPASVDLVDYKNGMDINSQYVDNTNKLEFDVTPASNTNDITAFIHKTLNDDTSSIDTMGALQDGRQMVTMKGGTKNVYETGFAYKLWYYPSQKKLVYIALGQSIHLEPTADPNTGGYYDSKIADSFKFAAN